MLDTPFWLIVSLSLTTYIVKLRQRMRGLNEPELWLPRRERRVVQREVSRPVFTIEDTGDDPDRFFGHAEPIRCH